MTPPELSAEHIVEVFNRHGVEYVVIGAFAAIAQGVPLPATHDVDLTPRRGRPNLERLSAALSELGARIRVGDPSEGLAFSHDAASLARIAMLNLTCSAGDFDLVFTPAAAPRGFDDLVGDSVAIRIGEQDARVASLEAIYRSKEEAGRDKDIRALPMLLQFIRRRGE